MACGHTRGPAAMVPTAPYAAVFFVRKKNAVGVLASRPWLVRSDYCGLMGITLFPNLPAHRARQIWERDEEEVA